MVRNGASPATLVKEALKDIFAWLKVISQQPRVGEMGSAVWRMDFAVCSSDNPGQQNIDYADMEDLDHLVESFGLLLSDLILWRMLLNLIPITDLRPVILLTCFHNGGYMALWTKCLASAGYGTLLLDPRKVLCGIETVTGMDKSNMWGRRWRQAPLSPRPPALSSVIDFTKWDN